MFYLVGCKYDGVIDFNYGNVGGNRFYYGNMGILEFGVGKNVFFSFDE